MPEKKGMTKGKYYPDKDRRDSKDTEGGKKVEKANKEAKKVTKKKEDK